MLDSFERGGYKNHVKTVKQIWKHIFSVQPSGFVFKTSVSNNLDYRQFFWRDRICFGKVSTSKMVASLEYSKIQNNSIIRMIMTDTYNTVHM